MELLFYLLAFVMFVGGAFGTIYAASTLHQPVLAWTIGISTAISILYTVAMGVILERLGNMAEELHTVRQHQQWAEDEAAASKQ